MKTELVIPSKTFLIGEYLSLTGGPSIIATTKPLFSAQIKNTPPDNVLHPSSPAARYMATVSYFQQRYLHFQDPYQGQGGFGASTAAFLAAALFAEPNISQRELIQRYRDFADYQGRKPSGADLLAQYKGGLAVVTIDHAESYSWPFQEIGFTLAKTPHKLSTHEHLASLVLPELSSFYLAASQSVDALKNKSSRNFLNAIIAYQQALTTADLVAPFTQTFIQASTNYPFILAAKGCGALGADVIAVFYYRENQDLIDPFLQEHNLISIARDSDLWS